MHLGDYGLPPALPITWYLSLALAVVGAVTAITMRRTSGLIMVGYVVVVAVILFGTVPVLSAQPHYAWVYKHIGVVRYLEAHGKANANVDIYNRWPGFFALGAVFSQLGGSPNPETYAGWAELVFLVLDAVLVMAAVKAVTREMRIAAGAGLFFVVTNWVGQTYYSPQAFAFVLGLALIVILLRQLRINEPSYSPRLTRWVERIGTSSAVVGADERHRKVASVGSYHGCPGHRCRDRRKPSADALHVASQYRTVDAGSAWSVLGGCWPRWP